jgi:glycosyltransferase involved in cell wall biosynthesis
MAVYNGEQYIAEAVNSILTQTYEDFEFLIIDDASTDETPKLLEYFARKDSRIRIHRNSENMQLAATLNVGLNLAQSPLVARMDADDIAMPHRLQTQVDFMRTHPDITVCGTALEECERAEKRWVPPETHEEICAKMLFQCCLYHPTVIYRKAEVLALGGYDDSRSGAEDYDLWQRLIEVPSVRFTNLNIPLLRKRIHPGVVRDRYRENQRAIANQVRQRFLSRLGLEPDALEAVCHEAISSPMKTTDLPDLMACQAWIDRIEAANLRHGFFSHDHLRRELIARWANLCLRAARGHPTAVAEFLRSRWAPLSGKSLYNVLLMLWRSIKPKWK